MIEKDVTVVIITYKSEKVIYDFINKIPSNLKDGILKKILKNCYAKD